MLPEFRPMPKIPRLYREIVITEKLDGTNASVYIDDDGAVTAASRSRWITPEEDNFGFAAWVREHEEPLRLLGPGHHFGEWWGLGINRGYNMTTKRFSLFNVGRWCEGNTPNCVSVVPTLYIGPYSLDAVGIALAQLQTCGSEASFGFMKPEGIMVYHVAARQYFKVTLEGDQHKR